MDSGGIQPECTQPPPVAEPAAVRLRTAADANTPDPIPPLTEDVVLALLERRDVPPETLEEFSQNPAALKSRKVCVILAAHPHTPRHLALRLIRQFYTFDLMRFTHHPAVAADLKRVADEQLIARLTSVTLGERLTLARRGSQAVAAALLLDTESRVSHTALENSRLTEAAVIKALLRPNGSAFVEAVCHHPKWSLRREIRVALLRSPHTPLARALEFARTLPPPLLRDILHTSRLPEKIKAYLHNNLKERK
ncbi:MAG: hypothetical protein WB368_10975 [Candidatus Sulfotelmatobacter sp.]